MAAPRRESGQSSSWGNSNTSTMVKNAWEGGVPMRLLRPLDPSDSWGDEAPDTFGSNEFAPKHEKKKLELANGWDSCPQKPEKTAEELLKEELDAKLQDWPWRGTPKKLFTICPFFKNIVYDMPYIEYEVEQSSPLFKILKNDIIRGKILGLVARNHVDSTNWALSCRTAFRILGWDIEYWDIVDGFFNHCEYPRSGPGALEDPELRAYVPSVLLVTPIKRSKAVRYPDSFNDPAEEENLYLKQLKNLKTMCTATYHFADFFNNLQFHQIPFLTIEILNLIIPGMRNLKVLGVFKCQLIHVGHAIPLLDVIKVDKPLEREHQVYLDFYPNYHVGPKSFPGCKWHTGSYGVMWDNWHGDTRIAIWALVARIMPRALAQGIDWTKPGAAFRKWLQMSPCWRIDETLADIMNPDTHPVDLATSVDFPKYQGDAPYFMRNLPNRPEGWEWATKIYKCKKCKTKLNGIYFHYNQIRQAINMGTLDRRNPPVVCLGCTLTRDLDNEDDHYKRQKRLIIHRWVAENEEGEINTTDLPRALEEFDDKDIESDARDLDVIRISGMRTGPVDERYDREYEERQRVLTRAELGRLGMKHHAPEVEDEERWLALQKLPEEERQWACINKDRLWGHGHGW